MPMQEITVWEEVIDYVIRNQLLLLFVFGIILFIFSFFGRKKK